MFADKFQDLHNYVSYKKREDMDALLNDINGLVITKCECFGQCMHETHSIIPAEVGSAIEKLKSSKKDGSTEVVSDHIINACERLNVNIAILFSMMLRHGLSPDGILCANSYGKVGKCMYPHLIMLEPLLLAAFYVHYLMLL